MRSMKILFNRIVLYLICILIITGSVGVSAAEVTSEKVSNVQKAEMLLKAMGVYSDKKKTSNDNNNEQPESQETVNISKGEFVNLILKTIKYDDKFLAGELEAADDEGYAESLKKAEELRLTDSKDGDKDIKFGDAMKIAIDAMGEEYKQFAELIGGYPTGYYSLAHKTNMKLPSMGFDKSISRSDMLNLIYGLFDSDYLDFVSVENGEIKCGINKTKTFLSGRLKIYTDSGIIDSTGYSSLSGNPTVEKGFVSIGGETYSCEKTAADSLLGYAVKFYYEETDEGHNSLLGLWKDTERSLELNAEDIDDFRDGTYFYYDKNDKKASASVSANADYIFNGAPLLKFDKNKVVPKSGTVTLVDRGSGYSLVVINSFEDYFVTGNDGKIRIYDENNNNMLLFDTEDSKVSYAVVDSMGNPLKTSNIEINSVISVAEAQTPAGRRIINIIVSTRKAKGLLQKTEEDYITVSEEKIKLTDYYKTNVKGITAGDTVEVYKNFNGEAVYAKKVSGNGEFYAYIMGIGLESGAFENTVRIKAYTSGGAFVDTNIDEKTKIDGYTFKTVDNMYNYLFSEDKLKYGRVIRVKIADDKIKSIDTTNKGENEGKNSLSDDSINGITRYTFTTGSSALSNYQIGRPYVLNDDTVIMTIPEDADGLMDEDRYRLIEKKNLANQQVLEVAGAYDRAENGVTGMVLVKGSGSGMGIRAFIVSSIEEAWDNEKEESVKMAVGYVAGKEKKLFVEDYKFNKKPLSCGDVLEFSENTVTGYMSDYNILFSALNKPDAYKQYVTMEKEMAYLYGKCYIRGGVMIQVALSEDVFNNPDKVDLSKTRFLQADDTTFIYKYNSEKKKMELTDMSDVYDFRMKGKAATEMFVLSQWTGARDIIIVD
ncbi:MAG: hypothetical protein EGR16_03895 [Clostridiales bacterium]|nr:hypothetical protein [Clostridiales bacterium]